MNYTDGKYVYYVSALLGVDKFAVCRKEINRASYGNHKYRSPANKTVETPEKAQKYLDKLAKKKGWGQYD